MHIETAHIFSLPMSNVKVSELGSEKLSSRDESILSLLSKGINVIDCPKHVDALIYLDASFEIFSKIKPSLGEDIRALSPQSISLHIKKAFDRSPYASFFDVDLGGLGFVNLTPTKDFKKEFYFAVLDNPQSLFSFSPIITRVQTFCEKPLKEFFVSVREEHFKSLIENARNLDARTFGDSFLKSELKNGKDALMALCLCADEELDVRVYEQRLCSSENVPWWFSQISKDMQKMKEKCFSALGGGAPSNAEAVHQLLEHSVFVPLLERLLNFREVTYEATFRNDPLPLLKYLHEMGREWYAVYNRPQTRVLEGFSASIAMGFLLLLEALSVCMRETLSRIEFSCTNQKIVLQVED